MTVSHEALLKVQEQLIAKLLKFRKMTITYAIDEVVVFDSSKGAATTRQERLAVCYYNHEEGSSSHLAKSSLSASATVPGSTKSLDVVILATVREIILIWTMNEPK